MSINRNKVQKRAQKQIRKRNWSKALREYKKLADDDPSDMRSLLKCGDLYVKLDQNKEALESYKSVADNYAQKEMFGKAIAVYKQALRLDPEDVQLHHAVAECYYRRGRLKDAVRTFHDVQAMYKEQGDYDSQREILEHMVRIDPDDVGLRIQLAERYTKDDLQEAALQAFTQCAQTLEEEGRLDELLQVWERILFLTPDRHDLRKKVVRLYLDRQDNQTALKHLQICFRDLPKDIETLELLSQTFERLDRIEKAVMVIEELAPLYEEAQREADAQNLYRRLLRLDPDNETARRALGTGPDSGVMAGPTDTGTLAKRQRTPAPSQDAIDSDVEFLDDDVEFLDDDVEFLDDDAPVKQPATASGGAPPPPKTPAPPPPKASAAPPSLPSTSPPENGPPKAPDVGPDGGPKTMDVEALEPLGPPQTMDLSAIEPLDEIEPVDDDEPLPEDQIRKMLGECDVFLKYGLYDKAAAAIGEAIEASPKSLFAHERLLNLHEATGNTQALYQTLLTLAELTVHLPARAYDYLQRSLEIAPEPMAVKIKAKALDIDLDAPPPTDDLADISVAAIEPVEDEVPAEPQTMHIDVDSDDIAGLQEPSISDEEVEAIAAIQFLDPDDDDGQEEESTDDDDIDLLGDALDDIDDAFDHFAGDVESSPAEDLVESTNVEDDAPPPAADSVDSGSLGLVEATDAGDNDSALGLGEPTDADMVEPAVLDTDEMGQGLDEATDPDVVTEDTLLDLDFGTDAEEIDADVLSDDFEFGDGDEIMDMDLLDDDADFDDADLEALDEDSESQAEASGPDVNSLFDGVEADDLFGSLFGDEDEGAGLGLGADAVGAGMQFGDDDPDGEMAEIDFFIQQGLSEEAQEALESFAEENPTHPGIEKRREQIEQVRDAGSNFFGARSLSEKFNMTSLEDDEPTPEANSFDSIVNSNIELGVAYRDMGLIDEAIEEFNQAAEDPDAAPSAYYNIGLCEMELDQPQQARSTFHKVLDMDDISSEVRSAVRQKIEELETQVS